MRRLAVTEQTPCARSERRRRPSARRAASATPRSRLAFATEVGLQLVVASPDQNGVVASARKTTTLFVVKDEHGDFHLTPYHYWNHAPATQTTLALTAETVARGERGFVVIDTAPTGHTLLLLDAAEAYHREVERRRRG